MGEMAGEYLGRMFGMFDPPIPQHDTNEDSSLSKANSV